MVKFGDKHDTFTMKINKVYERVRKTATRKWTGPAKTGLPNGKSLPEDYSPGSHTSGTEEFSPSMEFSDDCVDGEDVPALPLDVEDGAANGEKDEPQYYRGSPRVVFFDEEVLVRRVRPVYQIGGQIDRRILWYQEDEYKEIMWKARRLVKRALNDEENTNNKEKYCLRGLEHVTNSITRRTKQNLDGREAVLDEQCLQFQNEVFPLDDNKIASVYLPFTKSHRTEAIERGNWDAQEVELYQQAPSSTSSSRSTRTSNCSHSSHSSLQTPKTPRNSFTSSSTFKSPTSPASPSLINKPGMMFTYGVDKTIQYPAGMKLETI